MIETIHSVSFVRIPHRVSALLGSRGIVMVRVKRGDYSWKAILEPDGTGGHWLGLESDWERKMKAHTGDRVSITLDPIDEWIEPHVPEDMQYALDHDPKARQTWLETSAFSRWDWIRSIRATHNPETRQKRIAVAISKLREGKKRQCCFNRTICSVAEVSKNWILLPPEKEKKSFH